MTTKNSDNKKAVYNGILMEYVKRTEFNANYFLA